MWNFYARYYNLLRSNPFSKAIYKSEQQSIQDLLGLRTTLSNEGSAADLGCGSGTNLQYIPSDITNIYALDSSTEMIAIITDKYKDVKVSVGDVRKTHYASGSLDLIFCIGVSEYIEDVEELIREIKRILGKTGYIIFTSSPPHLLNRLRKLAGHCIYPNTQKNIIEIIMKNDLKILSLNRTMIQDQYLLTHNSQASMKL